MIRRHGKRIVLFLCIQALAVGVIIFGSLINFHQYKIWGKPLIPAFTGYKRDVEKYTKDLSFAKNKAGQQYQHDGPSWDFVLPADASCLNAEHGMTAIGLPTLHDRSLIITPACGLRGPPVS